MADPSRRGPLPDHSTIVGFSGRTPRTSYAFVLWQRGETDRAGQLFDQTVAENERLMDAGNDLRMDDDPG